MPGFTDILLRTSTERPDVLDKRTVVVGGIKGAEIEQAIELAIAIKENNEPIASIPES